MNNSMSSGGPAHGWKWSFLLGLFMIAVGFLAAFNPYATGFATGVLLGIVLALSGGSLLAAAWSDRGLSHRLIEMLLGLFFIVGGAFAIYAPLAAAVSLAWMIGIAFAVLGVFELIAGFKSLSQNWPVLLLGIADILIGFYVMFSLPQTALVLLAVLVGLSFVLRGVILTALGWQLRKLDA